MLRTSNKKTMIVGIMLLAMPIFCPFVAASDETKMSGGSINLAPNSTDAANKSETAESNPTGKDKTVSPTEVTNTKPIEPADSDEKHLFMWKATRDKQIVYLLGTIHVVTANFYPLPDGIDKALSDSKELFVECIPDRDKILNVSKSLRSKYAYKNGDNLYKHLTPATQRVFEEYLQWAGEPMEIYETYRPFEVSGLIESDSIRRYGLTVPGIDRYLLKKAKDTNKKIGQLESVEFQLNLLSSLSEPEQDAELMSSLLTLKDVATHLDQMIRAWRQGNADELEQLDTSTSRANPELAAVNDKIITARNHGMVSKLEECLKQDGDGTYLVAVGAAHLVGKDGLPALLKEKGFSISQVAVPKEVPKTEFGSFKLQRLYYPEGRFSILLPGPASTQYGSLNGLRIVNYVYPTFAGNYSIGYLIMPETIPDAAKLNSFYNLIGMSILQSVTAKLSKLPAGAKNQQVKLGSVVQNSINMCDHFGRQIQMELTDPHGDKCLIRIRLVVIDRYLYILTIAGKKMWVNSPIAVEVQNSLTVRSASSTTKRPTVVVPNKSRRH